MLTGPFGPRVTSFVGTVLYGLAAAGLLVSGLGLMVRADWFGPALAASAAFSTIVILIFWDGERSMLVKKGFLGLLINPGIIGAALLTK